MKFIDEKGKFLGLINIVDLIIILLVILVGAGAAYKFTHKSVQGKPVTVEFQVLVPCIRPELAAAVKVGDKMVQGSSYTSVTVKGVEVKPGFLVNSDSTGKRVMATDPYLKDLFVTNTGTTLLTSASITMGGQDIRAGKDYYVKSRDYELKGTIIKVKVTE